MSEEALKVVDMIRGLVRAAEILERNDNDRAVSASVPSGAAHGVWDDEVRHALARARELGWGSHKIGDLPAAEIKMSDDQIAASSFDAFQGFTQSVARYPGKGTGSAEALAYTACGLAGEVGEALTPLYERLEQTRRRVNAQPMNNTMSNYEDFQVRRDMLMTLVVQLGLLVQSAGVLEQMKRQFREGERKLPELVEADETYQARVMKELGDVQWYVASHAKENKLQLSWVVAENIRKLRDRAARGKLHGSGDNR